VREAGTLLYQIPYEEGESAIAAQTDITLRHLELVCQRVAKMDRYKMFINFEMVAMHLSLLLKVCHFSVIS
jgi:hypothetical protein